METSTRLAFELPCYRIKVHIPLAPTLPPSDPHPVAIPLGADKDLMCLARILVPSHLLLSTPPRPSGSCGRRQQHQGHRHPTQPSPTPHSISHRTSQHVTIWGTGGRSSQSSRRSSVAFFSRQKHTTRAPRACICLQGVSAPVRPNAKEGLG